MYAFGRINVALSTIFALRGNGKLFKSVFTSFIAISGNSRGFGLSILIAYIISTNKFWKLFSFIVFSYAIYVVADKGFIRNINFDNLGLGLIYFLNIATSGRVNEILSLYEVWYYPVFGNGIGIIFSSLGERYWSHSFIFNVMYKTGYVGLLYTIFVFIIYLKPKNGLQLSYLIGIFLYSNLDFSILLNPLWVYLYRKLTL